MKTTTQQSIRFATLLALALALNLTGFAQPTATWNNGAADNDWNSAGNWDIGVPAEGTNAIFSVGNTVNYNAPMTATSFGFLNGYGVLNVNAGGFVSAQTGDGAIGFSGSAARFFINNGGAVSVSGGVTMSNAAALTVASGGTLTVGGNLLLGRNGTGNTGIVTNSGGTISAAATQVNPNNNSSSSLLMINGGTSDLGAVTVKRSNAGGGGFSTFGSEGFFINNGIVRMTSLDVGGSDGNSFLTMVLGNGNVTNSGTMTMRQGSGSRTSRFLHTGGVFVSGTVNLRGHTANNVIIFYSVTGGTNLVDGFILGNSGGGDTTGTIRLTNSAKIYIGGSGFSSVGTLNTKNIVLANGGVFGAQADWSGTEPILLTGGAFDAGDLDGVAHNISLSGIISGAAQLIKNGGGTLTLNAANTYSGNTAINVGTLALGASGSIANSPQITVAAGATFDVSAVAGYTLAASRTLAGSGTVVGDVAVASGGTLNPGTSPGTLTCANALTQTGGAINHFDLPTTPGPGNDLLVVNGDLNVSGVNALEISGGGSAGTVHTLIQYGGNFNGTLANFNITGASGVLSNDPPSKTIALIISAAIRTPTNVVWVGNSTQNDWDTVNRTNWSNLGVLDYFVTGDNVLFDAAGAANPNVNLVGNNAPASVTVDATGSYTFGGNGAITGTGGLTKTNSGILTITSTNTYGGATIIGGGSLEASTLANGGSPSAIGAATVSPNNLVFDGGTLRYFGDSVATDRGATINVGGGTIHIPLTPTTLTLNGTLTGPGTLTKSGVGALTLAVANNYAGGTILNNGRLQLNSGTAAGTGGITNYGQTMRVNGALTVDNILDFHGTCTLEFSGVGGGNVPLRGAWIGDGTVNVNFLTQNTAQTLSLGGEGSGGGAMWDFSGTVDFGTNRGFCRLNNNSSINFGSSNATFNLGTGDMTFLNRNGGTTTHLGALLGGPDTRLSGARNDVNGITTYSIGGKNLDTVFHGVITNGQQSSSIRPAAINKVGTGKLTLTGASVHTGITLIESGTLQVDGSFSASPVTVNGGTLSGNGSLQAGVTVNAAATISPGASIGQMTINTLTLSGGGTNVMEIDKNAGTNDNVIGLSGMAYGGVLKLEITGTLALGDSFKLFDSTSYSGAFDEIIPATPGGGYVWDTSSLTVDGTLKVAMPGSRIANFSFDGGNLSATGSGGTAFAEYQVLSSTNIAAPIATWETNTTSFFDGSGNFNFTTPVDLSEPLRFFLIQFQSP